MNAYASSDHPFPGRNSNDPIKQKVEERKRKKEDEDEKKIAVVCVCQPSSSANDSAPAVGPAAAASSSSSSPHVSLGADIPAVETGMTNVRADQEIITDVPELMMLGGFFHDLRNAAAITVSILDLDISEIRSASESQAPPNGIISDLLNQANPRIVQTLLNEIMVQMRTIEQQVAQRRVIRRELMALMHTIEAWLKLVKETRLPQINIFNEGLVDIEKLIEDFFVYETQQEVFRLTPTTVQLRELLEGIARLPFPQRHIDVDFRAVIDQNVPAEVIADATRLRQSIVNLLYNAFKFTRAGRVTLKVRLSPDGRTLLFSIQDTGAGITPEGINRLFDPFVQGTSGHAARTGLGLGLAIVKRLVTAFGGEVQVESTLGKGSTFHFTIPFNSK